MYEWSGISGRFGFHSFVFSCNIIKVNHFQFNHFLSFFNKIRYIFIMKMFYEWCIWPISICCYNIIILKFIFIFIRIINCYLIVFNSINFMIIAPKTDLFIVMGLSVTSWACLSESQNFCSLDGDFLRLSFGMVLHFLALLLHIL